MDEIAVRSKMKVAAVRVRCLDFASLLARWSIAAHNRLRPVNRRCASC